MLFLTLRFDLNADWFLALHSVDCRVDVPKVVQRLLVLLRNVRDSERLRWLLTFYFPEGTYSAISFGPATRKGIKSDPEGSGNSTTQQTFFESGISINL